MFKQMIIDKLKKVILKNVMEHWKYNYDSHKIYTNQ